MNFPEQYSPNRTPASLHPGEDYTKAPDRWLGLSTDISKRKPPLSKECLAAFVDEARAKGRMLTDDERAAIIKKFQ